MTSQLATDLKVGEPRARWCTDDLGARIPDIENLIESLKWEETKENMDALCDEIQLEYQREKSPIYLLQSEFDLPSQQTREKSELLWVQSPENAIEIGMLPHCSPKFLQLFFESARELHMDHMDFMRRSNSFFNSRFMPRYRTCAASNMDCIITRIYQAIFKESGFQQNIDLLRYLTPLKEQEWSVLNQLVATVGEMSDNLTRKVVILTESEKTVDTTEKLVLNQLATTVREISETLAKKVALRLELEKTVGVREKLVLNKAATTAPEVSESHAAKFALQLELEKELAVREFYEKAWKIDERRNYSEQYYAQTWYKLCMAVSPLARDSHASEYRALDQRRHRFQIRLHWDPRSAWVGTLNCDRVFPDYWTLRCDKRFWRGLLEKWEEWACASSPWYEAEEDKWFIPLEHAKERYFEYIASHYRNNRNPPELL